MKFIFRLALRNLSRHRKRTILACIGIGFGVAMFIWFDGMLRWADTESQLNLKVYEYGNFSVSTKIFKEDRDNFPLDSVLEKEQTLRIFQIAEKSGCVVAPRTSFKSMLSHNRGFGLPYVVTAIDPELDARVFGIKNYISQGSYLGPKSEGILIGSNCARELGVKIGDFITIETRTRYNTYQAIDLEVVGIFNCPDPVVNRKQVFITSFLADTALQTEGTSTEIIFRTASGKNEPALAAVRNELDKSGLNELTISTWQELGADYITFSKTKKGGSSVVLFLVFIIVTVGIINTMLMAVFERVREIGMMRALGMRDRSIIWAFVIESAGIGLLGGLMGLLLGAALVAQGVYIGIDFTKYMGDMDIGYRVPAVWKCVWNPDSMFIALVFAILCSALISILPARKAVKMGISDSIRHI